MQAMRTAPLDFHCKDKFLILSTFVPSGATQDDISSDLFAKDSGKHVEEKKLRVVLVPAVNQDSKQDPPNQKNKLSTGGVEIFLESTPLGDMEQDRTDGDFVLRPLENVSDMKMQPNDGVQLGVAKDSQELKLKLSEMDSKLREAEGTIMKLNEERRRNTREKDLLKQELVGGIEEENQHEKSSGGLSIPVCLRGCACECGSRGSCRSLVESVFSQFEAYCFSLSMVCSPGSGRMEVMARFLTAGGSLSQTIADDFARQKSAAEYICRQLREADEANLLHEEDMHVYGERPMTDPLQLVCCNICKKPIKDSHFPAHAELCRSLKLTEQTSMELDGSTGNRKPPRKERKKLSTPCATTAVGERRRSESMDNIDTAVSQSHLNSQIRVTPFSTKAQVAASMMDGTMIIPGNRDHQAFVMHPPTKRHKLIASSHLPVLESHGTVSGVTKTASFTDGITRKGLLERTVSEHGDPNHENLGQVQMQHRHLMKNDFPAPLATKIYYSQRTNRLRAAIRHLYFQDLSEEVCTDVVSPTASLEEMVALQDSSQRDPSFEQMGTLVNKESHLATMFSAQKSDHSLAKSSEICLLKAGGLPNSGLSNQLLLDNVSRSAATHVGLTRNNFLPKSYSFASNTGNPLGTMQQPNGSVPVI
ncbi:PapD-like superfamily [Sesbania bispinosa]|nr:PapD-like superfamily [Sesbania bispinosa]